MFALRGLTVRLNSIGTLGLIPNRTFSSSLQPLFQSESKCEVFLVDISFHSH